MRRRSLKLAAVRTNGAVVIGPAGPSKAAETEFMMLKDGGIQFQGTAWKLRASEDAYLKKFISSTKE